MYLKRLGCWLFDLFPEIIHIYEEILTTYPLRSDTLLRTDKGKKKEIKHSLE